jgi:hypothetical protein
MIVLRYYSQTFFYDRSASLCHALLRNVFRLDIFAEVRLVRNTTEIHSTVFPNSIQSRVHNSTPYEGIWHEHGIP